MADPRSFPKVFASDEKKRMDKDDFSRPSDFDGGDSFLFNDEKDQDHDDDPTAILC